jgi:hypothetical protein
VSDNDLYTRYLGTIAALNRPLALTRTLGRSAPRVSAPATPASSPLLVRIWREPAGTIGDRQ